MGQIKVEYDLNGIEGLCVITPAVHGDNRGYFMETYSQRDMEEAGFKSAGEFKEIKLENKNQKGKDNKISKNSL